MIDPCGGSLTLSLSLRLSTSLHLSLCPAKGTVAKTLDLQNSRIHTLSPPDEIFIPL